MPAPPAVPIRTLIAPSADHPGLVVELLAGADGLDRLVSNPHLQKTGLALAGFHEYLRPGRILVLGESEVHFLERRPPDERAALAGLLATTDLPAILVTAGLRPVAELVEACNRVRLPLLGTTTPTGLAMAQLSARLDQHLAERVVVHGVLMDLLGLGVLIVGESGIGKSECALELVGRGHRLVADDVVELRRRAESMVEGTGPEATRFFMEVRGLGLIDVQAIFGISAVCRTKTLGLVVQLERWDPAQDHDRLGLDDQWHELAGVRVALVRMPVAPGRSVATLVEVAARNELLKAQGYHAARTLTARLDARRADGMPGPAGDTP
jgi:HPr kinase/phosphorylase